MDGFVYLYFGSFNAFFKLLSIISTILHDSLMYGNEVSHDENIKGLVDIILL